MNPEDLRHLERHLVDTVVAGPKKDGEGNERLDQIAAVQVHVVFGLRDDVAEHPVGNLLGGAAVRVAGKHSVEVPTVERTDVDRPRNERGHVHYGHHDDSPAQLTRIEGAAQVQRRGDARVLRGVDAARHDEGRPVRIPPASRTINQPHGKLVGLALHQKLVHAVTLLTVSGRKLTDIKHLIRHDNAPYLSLDLPSSINDQRLAGDPTGVPARKEQDTVGDVLRRTEALQCNVLNELTLPFAARY